MLWRLSSGPLLRRLLVLHLDLNGEAGLSLSSIGFFFLSGFLYSLSLDTLVITYSFFSLGEGGGGEKLALPKALFLVHRLYFLNLWTYRGSYLYEIVYLPFFIVFVGTTHLMRVCTIKKITHIHYPYS